MANAADHRYWATVWRRLKADRKAIACLVTLVSLILAVVLGPALWSIDPEAQFLNQIASPPIGSRTAIVVDADELWTGPASNARDDGQSRSRLSLVEANTEFVRLAWQQDARASGYQLYRWSDGMNAASLGMPIAVLYAEDSWYEDRLNLRPQHYEYTLLSVDELGTELKRQQIRVLPVLAMSEFDAELAKLAEGETTIELPAHPLGTDHLGRDMLSRLLTGGQVSLFIGIFAPLVYMLFGLAYGATSALIGGRVDAIMMSVVDFVIALPFLLFMILFRVALGTEPGESGITALIIALIALGWPSPARLVRGEILRLREMPYIEAARLMGAGQRYLIVRHLIPNVMGSVLVSFTFAIPSAIFTEAFLSFIGMGVVPPAPSWGAMCNDGISRLLTNPHMMLFPALAISITVLLFNLLGDALRDAMAIRRGAE
ncbi:ABC transporter permease [Allohahella sp. A8]|uniref:ABC transporter permease n=1 Tax=Allohahella sp. A8 TaxID=3141461 RepID=UPI003A801AD5